MPYPNSSSNAETEGWYIALVLLIFGLVAGGILFASGLELEQTMPVLTVTMEVSKILLGIIMLVVALVCFLVFFNRRKYFETLYRQEFLADQMRDNIMFEMTALRAKLSAADARLATPSQPGSSQLNKLLLEHAGSAVMLLLRKERGFLQWGLWAARAAKTAYEFYRRQ